MALINVNADVKRLAMAIERIATVLERLYPEVEEEIVEKVGKEAMSNIAQSARRTDPLQEGEEWKDYMPRRNYL